MVTILFTLQASFNTPEYTSGISEVMSGLFKILIVVFVIGFIYRLFKPKDEK